MLSRALLSAGRRVREKRRRESARKRADRCERQPPLLFPAAAAVTFGDAVAAPSTPQARSLPFGARCGVLFDALAGRTKQERVPGDGISSRPCLIQRGADRHLGEKNPLSFLSLLRFFFAILFRHLAEHSLRRARALAKRGGQGERCVTAQSCPRNDERAFFCSTMAPSPFFFLPFSLAPPLLQKNNQALSPRSFAAEAAPPASTSGGDALDWDALANLVTSDEGRRELASLRSALAEGAEKLAAKAGGGRQGRPDFAAAAASVDPAVLSVLKSAYSGLKLPALDPAASVKAVEDKFGPIIAAAKRARRRLGLPARRLQKEAAALDGRHLEAAVVDDRRGAGRGPEDGQGDRRGDLGGELLLKEEGEKNERGEEKRR